MTLTVRIQPRDGNWITLGEQQDGGLGIHPESIEYGGDLSEYGCLDASFRIKQNPRWMHYHLEQFTPVVIADGGEHVWSGYIIATPTTFGEEDVEVVVQCEGWGQHLKDDCTDREWVIDGSARWVETRALPGITLSGYTQGGQLSTDFGVLIASFGDGAVIQQDTAVMSVTLDLGEGNRAKRVIFTSDNLGLNSASVTLYARSSDSIDPVAGGTYDDAVASATPAAAATTYRGTFTTGYRYVHIFAYYTGGDSPFVGDGWFRVTNPIVFTDTADESGDASILKASTVVSEVLADLCPLISTDTSKIDTTTNNIPNFPGSPGWRYAHELIQQANAVEGCLARLSPDPVPVFEYAAKPTAPAFMVGAGEYTLAEPAAQDGRGVGSRVISEYTNSSGARGSAITTAPAGANARSIPQTDILISNPSAASDAASWTASGASVTRDTATFESTPASLNWELAVFGDTLTGDITGTALKGRTYILAIAIRSNAATVTAARIRFGTASDNIEHDIPVSLAWEWHYISWTPRGDAATPSIVLTNTNGTADSAGNSIFADSMTIGRDVTNILVTRGRRRTFLRPMDSTSNAATALAIAQLELDAAQYPPFRGTLIVQGRIRVPGGNTIPVTRIPSLVGEQLLIENLRDPNTGNLGRTGRITTATYTADTDTTEIQIDNHDDFVSLVRNGITAGIG